MGTYVLSGDALIAGDVDKNGTIDYVDYILVKRIYMGTYVVAE
jgi:hypothetical protein